MCVSKRLGVFAQMVLSQTVLERSHYTAVRVTPREEWKLMHLREITKASSGAE